MDRNRILAIEDDAGVSRLLRHSLAREDFDLQIIANGKDGLAATRTALPDLILLDLGLPDIDGLEVCRRLKSAPETKHLPVVILTGKGEESDVVCGLEMGADDYIIKPFRPRILNARIRAVLRRQMDATDDRSNGEELTIGRLTLSPQREAVLLDQTETELSPSEFHFIHSLICSILSPDDSRPPDPSIGQEGMALYAENRLDRLLPIFSELLTACPEPPPLLCKFAGLAHLHVDTEKSECLLYRAAALFEQDDNPVAELSVLAHLILFHVFYDGKVEKAVDLFRKAEQLANPHFDRLSVFSRISVAQAQAVGHALLGNNFNRAYEYLSVAEALAEDRGLENFRVINLLVTAYEAYQSADAAKLARTITETLPLLNHPQISLINKALLKMPQLVYISMTGEFSYFRTIEQSLRDEFDALLPETSFPTCLLSTLQMQVALVDGDHDKLCQLQSSVGHNRLHQPTVTGMLAMSAALNGDAQSAGRAITACLNVTQPVTFVDMLGRLYCVRAYLELGMKKEATDLLDQLQTGLKSTNWTLIEIHVHAISLLIHSDRTLTSRQLATLQRLLNQIKISGVKYIRCLTRDDLRFILCNAVRQNIERPFAVDLCRSLLQIGWNRDWEPVPMLQFKTLGGLQLACEDQSLLNLDGFSRSQRECLALLIAAPKNRIDQEEMQLTFWPDSSPDKARANLDTMLSRLRKTVQARIKPLATKNYLKLQKGVISLDQCSFDTEELLDDIDRGRNLLRNKELWRADIVLSRAMALWNGDFIPGACVTNQTIEFANQIRQSCIGVTLLWSDCLNDLGQTARAIDLLKKALTLDRCNEELVATLHRSYLRSKNLTKAQHLLRQHEESLQKENYPSEEISRILTRIRSFGSR